MKRYAQLSCLTMSFMCFASIAGAHHSFAMFDRSQTQTIAGTVREFELINPHSWLRVLVANANGVQSEWSLELGGAGQLQRFGWTTDAVHPGDKVTVRLHPLRDGSYGGQLVSVTLPSGRVLGQRPPGA